VTKSTTQKKSSRVLIVDDDESIVVTIRAILERAGYQVGSASSYKDVLALIDRERFHVAIVDLRLGHDDGIDVLKALREAQPECVGIVLTGYASLESAMAAIHNGAYDYLAKPCDLEELLLTVARAAEKNNLSTSLQQRVKDLEDANTRIKEMSREMQTELERKVQDRTAELMAANSALQREIAERERAEATILQLSTPVLQIRERLLLVPIIGVVTEERALLMTDHVLKAIRNRRAAAIVMDLTGLASITGAVAAQLKDLIAASRLLGASTIVTGISPETGRLLIDTGNSFMGLITAGDLQSGIDEAERLLHPARPRLQNTLPDGDKPAERLSLDRLSPPPAVE
jgi:ActR/RegA family two-component response regulator